MDMQQRLAFAFTFGLGGLIGFTWSSRNLWLALRSHHWNLVDCDIIESRVEERSTSRGRWYVPIISYEYKFEGLHFEGNKIRYGGTWGTESEANAYCEKYPEGSTVKVSVDPIHPERSVLVPGGTFIYLAFIASIVSAVLGFSPLFAYLID